MHPHKEGPDADRRKMGGPVGNKRGIIDNCHPPTVAMANAIESFSSILRDSPADASRVSGPNSASEEKPSKDAVEMDPSAATVTVKGFAKYLGADLVGVCRSNPMWTYSHRGMVFKDRWDEWGEEISDPLPYAVVIATEMGLENVGAAPHTPVSVESEFNYALGACITIPLAQWFIEMGYQAKAQFAGTYDTNMVPLAIDAGLGELGRFGYLITDKFGPRVRVFAVTTNMPLVADEPVDLGAEEFCLKCLKCAETCPSRSIPQGDRTIVNGIHRWKLDEDSCFEYWAKVGTGCSICMGICPFSRPNRSFHRIVRWMLKRSPLARKIFPYLDNIIYGRKWHPRKVSAWISYPGNK
jgi:reductive dehalogenase